MSKFWRLRSASLLSIAWMAFNVAHHELWRDELHSWAIAAASESVWDVLARSDYEGHPCLWYLLLYGLQQCGAGVQAMPWLHWALAAGGLGLLLHYSPFSGLQKALLAGGYFFTYEYAALARNYAVEWLLLFGLCALYPHRRRAVVWLGSFGLVFLLMLTNLYGLITGAAFGLLLLAEGRSIFAGRPKIQVWAALAWLAALALAVWDILPPPGCNAARATVKVLRLSELLRTFSAVWDGMAPLCRPQKHFWNTNLLDAVSGSPSDLAVRALKTALALPLLVFGAALLRRKPRILLFYAGCTVLFLALIYTKYHGFVRHHGHFFVLLVAALWLVGTEAAPGISLREKWLSRGFTLLLALQLWGAVVASVQEWRYEFSPMERAARFLRQQAGFLEAPWISDCDYIAEGVAALLDKPVWLYGNTWSTYATWKDGNKPCASPCLAASALQWRAQGRQPVWLLVHFPHTDSSLLRLPGLRQLADFEPGIEPSEYFQIFCLEANK